MLWRSGPLSSGLHSCQVWRLQSPWKPATTFLDMSCFMMRRVKLWHEFRICLVLVRGGSRTVASSKMERFVIIVNGFQLPAVNYYHKALHLGCCGSPRSAPDCSLRKSCTMTFFNLPRDHVIKGYVIDRLGLFHPSPKSGSYTLSFLELWHDNMEN